MTGQLFLHLPSNHFWQLLNGDTQYCYISWEDLNEHACDCTSAAELLTYWSLRNAHIEALRTIACLVTPLVYTPIDYKVLIGISESAYHIDHDHLLYQGHHYGVISNYKQPLDSLECHKVSTLRI